MRIYIDPDELRTMAREMRAIAGAAGDLNSSIIRGWAHTPPPPVGLIGLGARSGITQARLNGLATQLWNDAARLDGDASRAEQAMGLGDAVSIHDGGWLGFLLGGGVSLGGSATWRLLHGGLDLADAGADVLLKLTTQSVRGYRTAGGHLVKGYSRFRRGMAPAFSRFTSARTFTKASGGLSALTAGLDVIGAATDQYASDAGSAHRLQRAGAAAVFEGGGQAAGGYVAMAGGIKLGGAIGTLICPVYGTVIGGLVGGAAGFLIGDELGNVGRRIGRSVKEKVFDLLPSIFR